MTMPERKTWFGAGLSTAVGAARETLRHAAQADRDGLDLFTVSDHPYVGGRLDAYSIVGTALGGTARIAGLVNVTNLPSRPAPMLARTITSLSALSGGRVVLGLGAGGLWDEIARLGVPRLGPGAAVRALGEAITLVRALCGGGDPVTFDGEFYQVTGLEPAPIPAPPVWTGSVGPKSLEVTGRLADGWIPGHAADWLSPATGPRAPSSTRRPPTPAATPGRSPRSTTCPASSPPPRSPRPATATAAGSVAPSSSGPRS